MNTGEKIVYQRKKHSITQEDLANEIGVSRQTVSKWETNLALPDTASVARLAAIFDVSTDYLIRDEVEEKECASQKKSLGLNEGLLIGFLTLSCLGFILSIVTAYATEKVLNGVLVFVLVWSAGIAASLILLGIYKNRCDYDEKDRRFLTAGTIGAVFAGIFTLGMAIPLPLCERAYNTSPAPSIVSIDLYWPWAFVGGTIALAVAFLLLPFLLSNGRAKAANKENTDSLFLACFLSACFLFVLTAGIYQNEAVIALHCTTTIVSSLVGLALIVFLGVRKALPLRSVIIASLLTLSAGYWFLGYYASALSTHFGVAAEPDTQYLWAGFVLLGVLALYFLVEGIIALKKKKGFLFMLAFIVLGSETLLLMLPSIAPTPSSVSLVYVLGYLLMTAFTLPGLILAVRYAKSLPQSAKSLGDTN